MTRVLGRIGSVTAVVLLAGVLSQAQAPQAPAAAGTGRGASGNMINAVLWTALDADQDGAITRAEMKGAFEKWYDAADTALFGDMKLIGEEGLDLAIVPIGDNYTMGPDDAIRAVKLLQPKKVLPIHYNTWELIAQDADAWADRVRKETKAQPVVLKPGESAELGNIVPPSPQASTRACGITARTRVRKVKGEVRLGREEPWTRCEIQRGSYG